MKAVLVLENGMCFEGNGFGYQQDTFCEVVFNSAMCGYTELLTDPSYAGQGVVMTYPMIGNYGICYDDAESVHPWLKAFIVHSLTEKASNFRCDVELDAYLQYNKVPGMEGVDTRHLTKVLRESGTMRGKLCYGENVDPEEVRKEILEYQPISCVPLVSSPESKQYGDGPVKIALMDYGVKLNIVRSLVKRGCTVRCFPHTATFEDLMAFRPDGIMLSNGPGDPQDCVQQIQELKKVYAYGIPTFAICLGHQLMALAQGAETYKLTYGHRGINHPVKDLSSGRVYITSQNHGYVVDEQTVDTSVGEISFVSMNDGSVEGLRYKNGKVFSVQFHPEAASGPKDTGFLFDMFLKGIGGSQL